MNDYVIVDLSPLIPKMGNIIPGINIEYAIINYYQMIPTNDCNTIDLVNEYITNYLHCTKNVHYKYDDTISMVKEKYYNTAIFKFIGYIEQILLYKVNPYVNNICYDSIVDKDKLIVKFRIIG